MAFANWSAQDVPLCPHWFPRRMSATSLAFFPSTKRPMAFKFPLHPPVKATLCRIPFSMSKSICVEHTPVGLNDLCSIL